MDTARYPTASFDLADPIDLGPVPDDGATAHYTATGTLTLHGTVRAVTIPLTASRTGDVIDVQGIASIEFADYGIGNPSLGPAHVGDAGQLEFLLHLAPQSDKETS